MCKFYLGVFCRSASIGPNLWINGAHIYECKGWWDYKWEVEA